MNFCLLGAGAWGTAMALHLLKKGHSVTLVPRRMEMALEISTARENRDYLPGFVLPENLQIGFEIRPVMMEADVAVLACPSQGLRNLCRAVNGVRQSSHALKLVITLCKGLEQKTFLRPSEVVRDSLPGISHAVLSGPSNAAEVARGNPTALTLGVEALSGFVRQVQSALSSPNLRVYTCEDVKGVELGGCLKNIYAIGCGCADGLRIGDNGKAALITRSLSEMIRLGASLGADAKTFFGLSGFGDLVATCNGAWSRNRTLGQQLGEGSKLEDLMRHRKTVVEGVLATRVFHELCQKQDIEAPILNQIYQILFGGLPPRNAIEALMLRDLKSE